MATRLVHDGDPTESVVRHDDVLGRVPVGGELPVVDEGAVEPGQHQTDHGHDDERAAPSEVRGQRPTERDAEHGAEESTGHEGARQRRATVRREEREHDGEPDAAVRGLTDAEQHPGREQLSEVRRQGGAQRGCAPHHRHHDDRPGPAVPVAQDRERYREQSDGEGDDARQAAELGVGQAPLVLEEREDRGQDLPDHVVRQQQGEAQREDDPREQPRGAGRGCRWGREGLRRAGGGRLGHRCLPRCRGRARQNGTSPTIEARSIARGAGQ